MLTPIKYPELRTPMSLLRKNGGTFPTGYQLDSYRTLWQLSDGSWHLQVFNQVPKWHDQAGKFKVKPVTEEWAKKEMGDD